ncbi:MAG: RNA ligase family protein [Candidatus Portnoybacteria bacterium]|nr:RNA ligase family protein [Candidatus Portnoybacteria bacterium]
MAYQHIDNLYKNQKILMFKECFAMEKIHGTSAHVSYSPAQLEGSLSRTPAVPSRLGFFSGGGNYDTFVALFDAEALRQKFDELAPTKHVHVYGEYYGGKLMGMSKTYGNKMKFVAFEVKIGDTWLNVPNAEDFCNKLGIEFVHYVRIPTTIEAIDAERDADSVQAVRNGMGEGHMREGIVLRPIDEVTTNNDERIVAKHKRDEFRETNTPRKVVSPDQIKKMEDARAIANEWVTLERLNHILNRGEVEAKIENTGKLIELMTEDIMREAEGEIVDSPDARKQIGRLTALMFKDFLKREITNT